MAETSDGNDNKIDPTKGAPKGDATRDDVDIDLQIARPATQQSEDEARLTDSVELENAEELTNPNLHLGSGEADDRVYTENTANTGDFLSNPEEDPNAVSFDGSPLGADAVPDGNIGPDGDGAGLGEGPFVYPSDGGGSYYGENPDGFIAPESAAEQPADGSGLPEDPAITLQTEDFNVGIISGDDAGEVFEGGATSDSGDLDVIDSDPGEAVFIPETIEGDLGSLTIDEDGEWTFNADEEVLETLDNGETSTEDFTVTTGGGDTHVITITATGTEDDPFISGDITGGVTEDDVNAAVATGDLDIENNPDDSFVADEQTGTHGTFTVDEEGTWTFTIDDETSQSLGNDDVITEEFIVTTTSGDSETVTVTITGTNDGPVAVADTASTDEDSSVTIDVLANDSDVDSDSISLTSANITDGSGSVSIVDGELVYNPDGAYDSLDVGDSEQVTVSYTVTDDQGASDTSTVTITVTGAEDGAVITGDDSGSVTEDLVADASGTLTATDADAGESGFVADSVGSDYGTFAIDGDGNWSFTGDNDAMQSLSGSDVITEDFTVTTNGGEEQVVTITINGAEDPAIITGDTLGDVVEDGTTNASGTLDVSDVDGPAVSFDPSTQDSDYGSLTIDASGSWTYTGDNDAMQSLDEGEEITEEFTVTTTSGDSETVSITITGTNDGPVAVADTATTDEDNSVTIDVLANDSDADDGATLSLTSANVTNGTGSVSIVDGELVYNPDGTYDSLDVGDSAEVTVSYTIEDEHGVTSSSTATITVTGAEDGAVITGSDSGSVTEDLVADASGTLTATDADAGESGFVADSIGSDYGTFAIDGDGNWSFTGDNDAMQSLSGTDVITEDFTVTTNGGEETVVTITINGAEDPAVITGDVLGDVVEDGTTNASGILTVSDVDGPAVSFDPSTQGSDYGSLTIDSDGNWTYTGDNDAMQSLDEGEVITEEFTVTTTSGDSETVTITITGTNDGPVAVADTASTDEDSSVTIDVLANDSDVDDGATLSLTSANVTNGSGSVSIVDGELVYNPDGTYDSLDVGDSAEVTVSYTIEDEHGVTSSSTATITVTGAEDGAVITGSDSGSVTEDLVADASGTLTATDADAGESGFVADSIGSDYGTFAIDGDGNWSFTGDNDAMQSLSGSDVITEDFTVTTNGGEEQVVTITINGAEDPAIITGDTLGDVVEDGTTNASGTLDVSDVDGPAVSFDPSTQDSDYGSLTIDSDGNWTYTGDNDAMQSLDEGEVITEEFTVTTTSGDSETVTITITGTNDGPVAVADTATTDQDNSETIDVLANDSDVDDGATLSLTSANVTNGTGSVSIVDGQLVYNPDGTYDSLDDGDSALVTVSYTIEDEHGATSTSTVTITVTGTEDGAVITGDDSGAVTEDVLPVNASGTLTATDDDPGESGFVADSVGSDYGTFAIDGDGNWSFTGDNDAMQSLSGTDVITEDFTVTTNGGEETVVTITINGAEDPAVITGDVLGDVVEDGTTNASGILTVSDVDGPAVSFDPSTQGSDYGSLTIDSDGNWTYTGDNDAMQSLDEGEVITEEFTVTTTSGDSETVTITITGTNDGPVAVADTASTDEDSSVTIDVLANDSDVDDGATLSLTSATITGGTGSVSIVDGQLVYNPDGTYDSLDVGDSAEVTVDYIVTDDQGVTDTATVTITVTGNEDGAVITGSDIGSVTEDAITDASGTLTATDADAGESGFVADSVGSDYGTFAIDGDGNWSFTGDNDAMQSLSGSDVITEDFTVTTNGGEETVVTITINGAEDPAVITGDVLGDVVEDGTTNASGILTVSDVDGPAVSFDPSTQGSDYGSLTIDSDGNWTYTGDNEAMQSLDEGEVITEEFTVTTTSGDSETVSITITGTNDGPVAVADTATTDEDSSVTIDVLANDSDVDDGATLSLTSANVTNGSGSVSIVDGELVYNPDGTYDSLDVGDSAEVTVDYTVTDEHGVTDTATVTITVTGAEDGAVITGSDIGSVTEDAITDASGTLTATDADAGESGFVADSVGSDYGTFAIDGDGNWSFTGDNDAMQSLSGTDVITEEFTVTTNGGETDTVTITINGAEDPPVITGDTTGGVTEDSLPTTTSGILTVSDVDGPAVSFDPSTQGSEYGSLTIDSAGNWSYTGDNNAMQSLDEGEEITEEFTVTTTSGDSETVTITLTGTNDGPVAVADTATTDEDTSETIDVLANDSDVDDGATLSLTSATITGGNGTVSIVDGQLVYNPGDAYNYLDVGDSAEVTVDYIVTDEHGATDTATVTITVTGNEDGAVITGSDIGSVTEDAITDASGTLTATDPDAGESGFVADSIGSDYGTFAIDGDGNWSFTGDNNAMQSLSGTDVLTEEFTVTTNGGEEQVVTITINGAEDPPVITGDTTGGVTEDSLPTTTSGILNVSDVDGPTVSFDPSTQGSEYGSLTIDASGNWSYTGDNNAMQSLDEGEEITEEFTVTTTSGDSETVTITLTGTNDGPVAVADTATTDEDSSETIDVLANDSDVDDGAILSLTSATITGGSGSVSIVDGQLVYNPDGTYNYLDDGESEQVTVDYIVTDEHGVTDTATVTITVTGNEDGAVITGSDIGSVTEDAITDASGTLTATDPDAGESGFVAYSDSDSSAYGTFAIDGDGNWSFTGDNDAMQSLSGTDVITQEYTVTTNGGETEIVTITINGAEDGSIITGDVLGDVVEDGITNASGTLTVTDVDGPEVAFTPSTQGGAYGSLTIDDTGSWTYTGDNNAMQSLAEGEEITESFTVNTTDGNSETIDILVTGINDAPIAVPDTAQMSQNEVLTIDPRINDIDVDGDELSLVSAEITDGYGFVTIVDGQLVYNPDGAYYDIGNNEPVEVTIDYTIEDEHGATSTSTITVTLDNSGDHGHGNDTYDFDESNPANTFGTDGNDIIIGTHKSDDIVGGEGDDILSGGAKGDNISGGLGDDTLSGDGGDDLLLGRAGDDILDGGAGDDVLLGSTGDDIFTFSAGDGSDLMFGGEGSGWTDTIALEGIGEGATTTEPDNVTVNGDGWTMVLDSGTVTATEDGYLDLTQDASGTIQLDDGSEIHFEGMEKITW